MEHEILLSTDSRTFYTGVAVEPWTDDPREALVYTDPGGAWDAAKALEGSAQVVLEGTRLELHLRNPEDPRETQRGVNLADENNRPLLRTQWSTAFDEALPVDLPRPPVGQEQIARHMDEYLHDLDWKALPPGDPALSLDQSFREAAAHLAATDPAALAAMWQRHAPSDIPLSDLNRGQVHDQQAAAAAVGVEAGNARPDPAAEAFRAARANAGHQPSGEPVHGLASPPAASAIPGQPGDRAATLTAMDEYLAGVDWEAIREKRQGPPQTRGEIGLDPKFWASATRLSLAPTGRDAVEELWARHAPPDFPPPFQATPEKEKRDPAAPVPERQGATAEPVLAPSVDATAPLIGPLSVDVNEVRERAAAARGRDRLDQTIATEIAQLGSRTRTEGQANEPNEVARALQESTRTQATYRAPDAAADPDAALPTFVRRHFVHTGDDFYYRADPTRMAFQAQGDTFKAKDPSVAVATALVEMAQSKGWGSIKVKGTDEFKARVYEAALARGLKVEGYTPGPGEQAAMDERQPPPQRQGPERGLPSGASAAPRSAPTPAAGIEGRAPQAPAERAPGNAQGEPVPPRPASRAAALRGVLDSHGAAPYHDDPKGSASYYVRLKDPEGHIHTHWGVDLRRAVEAAGVKPGDAVQLGREGRQAVTVKVREVAPDGTVTFPDKPVQREMWSVRPQERDQSTEAMRTFVDRQMPNLAPEARERLMTKVREQQRGPEAALVTKVPPVNEVAKGRTQERAREGQSR